MFEEFISQLINKLNDDLSQENRCLIQELLADAQEFWLDSSSYSQENIKNKLDEFKAICEYLVPTESET